MKKKIILGTILATFLILILPSVQSVECSVSLDKNNEFQDMITQLKEQPTGLIINLVKAIINFVIKILSSLLRIAGNLLKTGFGFLIGIIGNFIKSVLGLGPMLSKFVDILVQIAKAVFNLIIDIVNIILPSTQK